jgi:S-ribosylhomocysteine lyase
MEKIASFRINHLTLMPGVYESRVDTLPSGDMVTTYDIRMTAPNREPALSVSALHAMEHIIATFLRNHHTRSSEIVYWGPMGCCTGNYLLMKGRPSTDSVRELMAEAFQYLLDFEGDVPGAAPRDCGNYLLMSLPEAKMAAKKYLQVLNSTDCPLTYPE